MQDKNARFNTLAVALISLLIGAASVWIWTRSHPDDPSPTDNAQPSTDKDAPRGNPPDSKDDPDKKPPEGDKAEDTNPSDPPPSKADNTPDASPSEGTSSPDAAQSQALADNPPPDAGSPPDAAQGKADKPPATLDKEAIRDVIKGIRPSVARCYNETLKDFPEAEGKIVTHFTIVAADGQGHVDMEKIGDGSTLHETTLHECMVEQLRGLTFPTPEGGGEVKVTYPFKFKNAGGKDAG